MQVLDPRELQARRRAVKLSLRAAAAAAGISVATLSRLERGATDEQLQLGHILHLARVLGCAPRDLFAGAPTQLEPDNPTADARALIALLQHLATRYPRDDIARSFGWDLRRLAAAATAAEKLLAAAGLSLHRFGGGWQLLPAMDALPPEVRAKAVDVFIAQRGMTVVAARLLRHICQPGGLASRAVRGNSENVYLGWLMHAGLVEQRGALLAPTARTQAGLDLLADVDDAE